MLKSHLLVCTNQHRIPSILSPHQLDQVLSEDSLPHIHPSDSPVCGSSTMSESMSPVGSVSTSGFSVTSPPRPGTADSSIADSDVFYFPDDNGAENLAFMDDNKDAEVEVFVTSGKVQMVNGNEGIVEQPLQTFALSPSQDISFVEEIVIDSTTGPDYTEYLRPDSTEAMRLDSCSSVDTTLDGRYLGNSTGAFSCSDLNTSCYDNSFSLDASTASMGTSISTPGFNQGAQLYVKDDGQKQTTKTTQELVESLVTELNRSNSSDFDLSAINVAYNGDISNLNIGTGAAPGLAESTSDLRHSLAFAYSRVHDMCDVDLGYPIQEFLVKNNAVP
ncbi:hypothetical protein ElyMa_000543100 [Elysia marginata]|uniref:Uncharacterized protein n=1 Tax=Elysia marginata TaxID=1093978 RepID=A0AAV4G018_9GAST|nr:hypothetical protein ElyMa_000543100 [Elysia marginata]